MVAKLSSAPPTVAKTTWGTLTSMFPAFLSFLAASGGKAAYMCMLVFCKSH